MTFQYRHRWARVAFIALLSLSGILFVGPMLVPSGIIAKRIAAAVERATGRQLVIHGGVTLWLLPRPGAVAERVTLSNAAWDATKPMLSVALVEANLRLLPLFLGRVELESIDIEAPTLNLAVNSEGQRNWAFVRATPASGSAIPSEISQPVAGSAGPSSPATLAVPEAPLPPPAAVPPPTVPLTTQLTRLLPHALQITNGIVTYGNATTGERYRLNGINLALAPGAQAHSLQADGAFNWDGKPVNATLRIEDWLEMLAGQRSDFSASLKSSVAQLDINGNGAIVGGLAGEAGIALRVAPHGEETPRLLARLGSLSVAAHVAVAEKKLTLTELTIERDGVAGTARGQVSGELIGSHPAVSGYIEFGRLDLDPVLSPPPPQEDESSALPTPAPIPAKSAPQEWPDRPLRLAPLHSWQGDLTLKGGPIIVRGIEIGPSVFHFSLVNGRVQAELQGTAIGNGHLEFKAEIRATEADTLDAHVQLSAKSIPVELMMGFGRRSLRDGSISAEGVIESHGASQRSLIGNLAGQLRISVDDGGFGLARIFERVRVVKTSCPPFADHGSANAEIGIRDGVVTLTAANLRAKPLDLAATGFIDLPNRHLDLRLTNGRVSCAPDGSLEGPWNDPSFASNGG